MENKKNGGNFMREGR